MNPRSVRIGALASLGLALFYVIVVTGVNALGVIIAARRLRRLPPAHTHHDEETDPCLAA